MSVMEILKVIFLGIVEGITEWLPISSTGHMLLVDQFLHLNVSDAFKEMFFVVIQLGAILAVVVLFGDSVGPLHLCGPDCSRARRVVMYTGDSGVGVLFWDKMWPFQFRNKNRSPLRRDVMSTWYKVVVACIPGAAVTLLFDDYIEAHLHTPVIIAAMLLFYGAAFILVERWNKTRRPRIERLSQIGYDTALLIGLFQVLSIIPGTSRSGATIVGALLIGVSRVAAAEFTFFLAVPVMIGLSVVKLVKFGFVWTGAELVLLLVGMAVAFIVSLVVVRFLMSYIKRHDFSVFGWYRIALGAVVLAYFVLL